MNPEDGARRPAGQGAAGEGIYLFCLARKALMPRVDGDGLEADRPLFVRTFGDVAAVLSTARLDMFCGPGAEARMKDLAWVGPRACRHQEVIEGVMRHSPVLPARFGTLFSSMDVLERLLAQHHDTVAEFLDEVADREEWSVKGMIDRERAAADLLETVLAEQAAGLESMSPGKRYFQEQRIRAGVDKSVNAWLRDVCKGLAEDFSGLGMEVAPRKLLSREATADGRDMVLNWAVLVPGSALEAFRERIDRANLDGEKRGLGFETSGPWPAYSFSPPLEIEPMR